MKVQVVTDDEGSGSRGWRAGSVVKGALAALAALPEDPSVCPTTHMMANNRL